MDRVVGTPSAFLLIAIGYVCIANFLRFSRMRKMHAKFGYTTRGSLANMSLEEAQKIQNYLYELEFPFLMIKALEFALFRTYGIPSISKLLVQTTQLSDPSSASKRVEDTKVLVVEFMAQAPTSDRALSAIARMNYIHSLYQKSGKISNDDMLYTLSLFALEPIRWVARHEWRELSDMERCAIGVFWKAMGDAMNIDFSVLSSPSSWKDGLGWLEQIDSWSVEYERKAMLPTIDNKLTADQTTNVLLWRLPASFRGVGLQAVSSLMDQRLRQAMMYAPPSYPVEMFVRTLLECRKYVLRYLAVPRPDFLKVKLVSDPSSSGRLHKLAWDAEPWYVEDSFSNRWGLLAWLDWFNGRPVPGGKYKPEGFTIAEVGPASMIGKGALECEREIELVRSQFGRGCPMAFGKVGT